MIQIPVHCGSKFIWSGNYGTSDASELTAAFETNGEFYIKSHKTGNLVKFYLDELMKDEEYDVVASRWTSACGKFTVDIFND